jgi:CHAT domain-containing protein
MALCSLQRLLAALVLALALPGAVLIAQTDAAGPLEQAEALYRTAGPEAALPRFEELVRQFHETGDRHSLARATSYVGEIQWRLGNYPEAEQTLGRALELLRNGDDRLQEGKTLNVLGLLQWDLGDLDQAMSYFQQGSAIAAEVGDRRLAGAILNNLSLVHDERGEYLVSLEQYREVLKLYEGQNFPRGEGDTLGNMGGVYLLLGRYREAIEHYRRALEISQALDSAISMSQDHGNLALAYLGLGAIDRALPHLDEAVSLAGAAGMMQDEAYWMRHKGNALVRLGRHGEGLELHRAALERYDRMEGRTEKIEALHDMGGLYRALGDSTGAERHYRQSMELAREVGVSRAITANLMALGELQALSGQFDTAAERYREAMVRARESGEMAAWSEALLLLSEALREQHKLAAAADAAGQALKLTREIGAIALEARALFERAESERAQGREEAAVETYRQSLALIDTVPDAELEWKVHYGHGLALAAGGDTGAAITALGRAIRVIEGVRETLDQDRYRAGYVQDKYKVYVDLVRLQLEAGDEGAAFSTAERLRSRSYLDLVGRHESLEQPTAGELQEAELRERIIALRQALAREQILARPQQRQAAIQVYTRELLDAEQAYEEFLDERRRIRQAPGPDRVPTFAEVRERLGPDEAVLEYVVGPDQIMLFVLTSRQLSTRVIPLRRRDLDNKVELIRNLLGRRSDERWKKPAASLSQHLVHPVLAELRAGQIEHIHLVPHGTLNYLPFALLSLDNTGQRRMIEQFTLAYLPTAAALLRDGRNNRENTGLLAMAPGRSRLAHADAEAKAIGDMFSSNSRAVVGEAATESVFKRDAGDYRLLHLATHGYFNKFNPMLSGLELESDETNDGQLELHEILGLRLDADLVTLSACQTALGSGHFSEVPAGDDFVGLTRAFLYAGSTSVMATLWEVDDASTLELMKRFYGGLAQAAAGEDKAAALAAAQRALLSSAKYSHPYFWAPFVLVGDTERRADSRT